jgi:dTDP-4-dehydrorhamnose 3,5-epimerase
MQRIETTLPDVYELRPKVFRDARGFFMETYHRDRFAEMGISDLFVEDNLYRTTILAP